MEIDNGFVFYPKKVGAKLAPIVKILTLESLKKHLDMAKANAEKLNQIISQNMKIISEVESKELDRLEKKVSNNTQNNT